MSKTHNLFISHSWKYSNEYEDLLNLLNARSHFFFKNFSVPIHDPIHTNGTDKQLHNAIYNKMRGCGVIIILAGVYSSYSKWINKEISIAKNDFTYSKPIVAINPWRSLRTSRVVSENADRVVSWNTNSIVNAIRELD